MTTDDSQRSPMAPPMDFTPRPSAAFSAHFAGIIDAAMEAERAAERSRDYIGASRLGEECLRQLGYEFHHTPKDEGREFDGQKLRIFERGHLAESVMVRRLKLAGFQMVTARPDGNQIRFGTAWSEERQTFLMSGGVDGVLTDGPPDCGIRFPALWENKMLGDKWFKKLDRMGLRAYGGEYFAQVQLYMAYLGLGENPALFTAENANTGELYAELVPFDAAVAQAASDKGVRVVSSKAPEELPRIATKATDFRCKMCDFPARCWGAQERPAVDYQTFTGFGTRA